MKYAKLRGRIRERFAKDKDFADAANMKPATVSRCLNGKRQWRGEEIASACAALGVPLSEAYQYNFFG